MPRVLSFDNCIAPCSEASVKQASYGWLVIYDEYFHGRGCHALFEMRRVCRW
jgi:hypothetical protein